MLQRKRSKGIARRLKEFRQRYHGGMTQRAFAEELGIDQQRLSSYEMNTRVPHNVIATMLTLGCNIDWLLLGKGPMFRESKRATEIRTAELVVEGTPVYGRETAQLPVTKRQLSDFYVLPLYADEAAAGEPLEMRDTEIEGPAIIHRNWCPNPDDTDYVRISATGKSMEPTIPASAIVTIDRAQTDPEKLVGKIVAIGLYDKGVTIKRLQKTQRGGYIGVPDNPSPEHRTIFLQNGDRIIGQVTTVHAWLE
ncbi:MAG: helix-turn-helix transcriptional regulator [Planctomycetes bacterium]|nr:helix-turn-helix transcriptional regulator [Planctomycetota bacterium]